MSHKYDDANLLAETLANGRHHLLQRFKRAIAGVAFAIPQPGQKRNVTAKTIQRQVAVLAIKTIKVGPFLAAVERIVGGIKIKHDLSALAWHGFDCALDEQLFNLIGLYLDLARR